MIDVQEKAMLESFDGILKTWQHYSDREIANSLINLHHMRLYLIDQKMLPKDILVNKNPDYQSWNIYADQIQDYIIEKHEKGNPHGFLKLENPSYVSNRLSNLITDMRKDYRDNLLLSGLATVWHLTLLAALKPALKDMAKQFWLEQKRGFPYAYNQLEKFDASIFGDEKINVIKLENIKEEILIVPAILDIPPEFDSNRTPQEAHQQALEGYENIIKALKNIKGNKNDILARVHHLRILYTNNNVFPHQLFDSSEPSNFTLEQYVKPIVTVMNGIPDDSDFNKVMYFCTRIWYFTLIGLITPELCGDKVREMWDELILGANGAYEIWKEKFYSPDLYNDKTAKLIDNMKEDITKIPAALR